MITQEEVLLKARHTVERPEIQEKEERPCVLLVEDDRSLRRYLEILVKRAGYQVVSAADGIQAIEVIKTSSVDIVVTDAIMPNLNGLELCRFLKDAPKLSHIPIILLSALEPRDAKYDTKHFDASLVKPVSNEDLLSCLSNLLSHRIK